MSVSPLFSPGQDTQLRSLLDERELGTSLGKTNQIPLWVVQLFQLFKNISDRTSTQGICFLLYPNCLSYFLPVLQARLKTKLKCGAERECVSIEPHTNAQIQKCHHVNSQFLEVLHVALRSATTWWRWQSAGVSRSARAFGSSSHAANHFSASSDRCLSSGDIDTFQQHKWQRKCILMLKILKVFKKKRTEPTQVQNTNDHYRMDLDYLRCV